MTQRYQLIQTCLLSTGDTLPLGPPFEQSTLNQCLQQVNRFGLLYAGWGNVGSLNLSSITSTTNDIIGSCYSSDIPIIEYTFDTKCVKNVSSKDAIDLYRRIINDVRKLTPLTSSTFITFQEFGTQWAWGIRFILATDGTNVFYTDSEFEPKFSKWKLISNNDNTFALQSETQSFLATTKMINNNIVTESDLQLTHNRTDIRVIKWNLTSSGEFSTIINGRKLVLVGSVGTEARDIFVTSDNTNILIPPMKVILSTNTNNRNLIIYSAVDAPFDEDSKVDQIIAEFGPAFFIFILFFIIIIVIMVVLIYNKRPVDQ